MNTICIIMRQLSPLLVCTFFFFFGIISMNAQSDVKKNPKDSTKNIDKEEDGPIIFKFEPNYLTALEKRREQMALTRSILDTLKISENKRRKLLRDLYKNGVTKRLSKVLVADNTFEDDEN